MYPSAMMRSATLLSVLCPIFSSAITMADTEPPRVVLGPGAVGLKVGPGMNAAGKDLRGCEFVGQDLTGTVFDGCNLYGVRIHECCLRNASFRGVVFAGVVVTDIAFDGLDGANFTDASINGGQEAARDGLGLGRLVLSPTQLMSTRSYRSKDLHECVIYNPAGGPAFDFRGADLRHSRLMGDFTKSDFTNARVRGATFELIALRFEQLASTYDFQQRAIQVRFVAGGIHTSGLQGKVDFTGIDLTGSKMGIPLAGVQLADARIEGCSLRLEKEQLYSTASYREGDLTNVQFNSCDLSQCNLAGMNLTGAGFSHCKFKGADFSGAVVTRAWFVTDSSVAESDQLTLDQVKSTWNYKHGRMKGIRLPESIAKALAEEKP